jgi:hypothetical protein
MQHDPKQSTYAENVNAIRERYAERMLGILTVIQFHLRSAGYETDGPCEVSCDLYRWSLLVYRQGNAGNPSNADVDIRLEIAESLHFEGTEDGINFSIHAVEIGGRVLSTLCPYNFTPDVWVDAGDHDAIETRFKRVEEADHETIVKLIAA